MRPSPFTSSPCSRRRALALAGGATALAQDPELSSLVGKIGLIPALMAPPEAPTVSLPAILPPHATTGGGLSGQGHGGSQWAAVAACARCGRPRRVGLLQPAARAARRRGRLMPTSDTCVIWRDKTEATLP